MEQSQPPAASKRKSNKWLWLGALLVALMLISIGIVGFLLKGYSTGPLITPLGSFHSWTQVSKDVYQIKFGVVSPETEFKECTIWIQPTVGNGSVESTVFVPTSGTFAQPATATAPGIRITDLNADNKINIGDLVTVTTRSSGYVAVDNGNWTIELIFIKSSNPINFMTFTVSGNP
jgi:hypothetical protein